VLSRLRFDSQLPPGSKAPAVWQAISIWARPTAGIFRARQRYGKRFTVRMLGQPRFVILSDPDDIREVFQASPEVLHPGEGARVLEPILGRNSVILLDETPHLEQRKLLLPAFHGESMQGLAALMTELAERELAQWPRDQAIVLHARLQRLTLEIVLRAVFGLEQGARLDRLRELLTQILEFTENPLSLLPFAQRLLAGRGPVGRLERLSEEADRLIFELIDERRGEVDGGPDVLSRLLSAQHEDGSPMSPPELRDELVTSLVAGHETTASQLAWGIEQLSRNARVLDRLAEELASDPEDAYLTATIHEIMRCRPVAMNEPRLVKQPVRIGGFDYPAGVALVPAALLVHHDPDIYPDPFCFKPERFLEREGGRAPGTYTWLPFGGGRRRCIGASFAMLEMRTVLRAVIEQNLLLPVGERPEQPRQRGITISPSRGCEVTLRERPSSAGTPGFSASQPAVSLTGVR
jgi:cytochrome P450